ncbi:MAG: pyrroline-5-carboxylate reductase [Myxococcales bacterium]|nr:pyrroline-5-carboxylate reductase [Myxococcales bacterium]
MQGWPKTIGFLGGGNMAAALVKGLLQSKLVGPEHIVVSDVKRERLDALASAHGVGVTTDNHELAKSVDVLVIAVKPQVVDKALLAIGKDVSTKTLVVSVAAGVPIESLESRLADGVHVVRAMPNTPAIVLAGATALSAGTHATDSDMTTASQLFAAVGKTAILDEVLLDAVTGLSGSGPAYVMLIIEALADGGVKMGLHRDTSLMLAAQTVYGSAKLLLETGEHPGRLKDQVTSPGGTAIAGLHTLESGALRKTLIDAVETASLRAAQLGEQMAAKMRRG